MRNSLSFSKRTETLRDYHKYKHLTLSEIEQEM